ncbi:MAG TPA: hypothetical protein ENH37_01495 [Deltaproteobacteria bacterium]|nr:hypothetical protein [Deltaproteobacteria bacterium]
MAKRIEELKDILEGAQEQKIYPCIFDLLTNGVVPSRFRPEESFPTRQDVTHFILAWLKHCDVPADRCGNWVMDYCVDELSRISSSSPSRIRHSTKSLIKYIYGTSDLPFDCGCEQNGLKAACDPDCPVYHEMKTRFETRRQRLSDNVNYLPPKLETSVEPPPLRVRDRYREQFEKAMEVVRGELDQGSSVDEIKRYLVERGYKTRTGKPWTVCTLRNEIKKHGLRTVRKRGPGGASHKSSKDRYRAQHENALKLIRTFHEEGAGVDEILDALEKAGYRTITGRVWTESNLRNTIGKFRKEQTS